MIQAFARGRLIDLGCGDMPFRPFIMNYVQAYDTLDAYPRTTQVTYVGDVQDMSMIPDDTYDTAICLEVLEHVPDPFRAVREIHRILKVGGTLILSVPHLSRLHDEPHDYYRFTYYGVRHLLEDAGFTLVTIERRGGLFSFLGHQVANVALSAVWGVPLLRDLAWFLNGWLNTRLCDRLDHVIDRSGTYALGYSAVAMKKAGKDPAL
jgi:SAM-dependent methyltransferase